MNGILVAILSTTSPGDILGISGVIFANSFLEFSNLSEPHPKKEVAKKNEMARVKRQRKEKRLTNFIEEP